jgi:hypothetical protein
VRVRSRTRWRTAGRPSSANAPPSAHWLSFRSFLPGGPRLVDRRHTTTPTLGGLGPHLGLVTPKTLSVCTFGPADVESTAADKASAGATPVHLRCSALGWHAVVASVRVFVPGRPS